MDAKTELKRSKMRLQLTMKQFMEETDIEESRKLSAKIKELATEIVNLRKEIKGEKEVRREAKKRRR